MLPPFTSERDSAVTLDETGNGSQAGVRELSGGEAQDAEQWRG